MPVRVVSLLLAVLFVILAPRDADALSRYERAELKPIKSKGEVVGVAINLHLRATGAHAVTRVSIGPGTMSPGAGFAADGRGRKMATDKSQGYLLHQFKDIKLKPNEVKKVTLRVLYKDAPSLKPGSNVEIIAAFNNADESSYWHIWGLKALGGARLKKLPVVPKKPAAKKPVAKKPVAKKPTAKKPTTRQQAVRAVKKKPRAARPAQARLPNGRFAPAKKPRTRTRARR